MMGCATIPPGEIAVGHRFGQVLPSVYKSGMYSALFTRYENFSERTQVCQEELDNLTQDLQSLHTTVIVKFRLNSGKLVDTYKTVAPSDKAVYQNAVRPLVLSTFKSMVSRHNLSYIASNWQKFAEEVEQNLTERLNKEQVVICESIELTGLKLDADFTKAIEDKQIAQQRLEKAKTEVMIAEQENLRNEKLKSSLDDKMLMKMMIERWDGKQPMVLPNNVMLALPSKDSK